MPENELLSGGQTYTATVPEGLVIDGGDNSPGRQKKGFKWVNRGVGGVKILDFEFCFP